jgi:hypothetical protein
MLELPSDKPLSGTEGSNVPYAFVDEVLSLHTNKAMNLSQISGACSLIRQK